MTKKRVKVTLLAAGIVVVVFLLAVMLPTLNVIGNQEKEPTPACRGYNTETFQGRLGLYVPKGGSGDDRVQGDQRQSDNSQKIGVAALEAACQANALAQAGFKMQYISLLVTTLALAIAILTVLVTTLIEDLRSGTGEASGVGSAIEPANLVIAGAYGTGGIPNGWMIANTGLGIAHVHGFAVLPYLSGANASQAAAAAAFAGSPISIPAGGSERFVWSGTAIIGDLLVAVRFTDVSGRRGVSWARFSLGGCPAHHEKQEQGCVLES
jgi:hypothetical protein